MLLQAENDPERKRVIFYLQFQR